MSAGVVDIIVPTNRVSRFLPAALESVRDQHYKQWHLLIVDDGSGLHEQLDRLAAHLPSTTVIHQPPAGVSAARNAGILVGTGEFVAFLDDDDVWPPDRLTQMVETLQAHPDAAGVFGDGRYIDAEGRVFGQWATEPATQEEFLTRATAIPRIVALIVRRSALEYVGLFDERLAYSEDDELILRLLRHAPLVKSRMTVVEYRRHDHNVTRADWRIRHEAACVAIIANISAAEQSGQVQQAAMLRRYLRRQRSWAAEISMGRVIGDLKAGRFRSAALDTWDSVRIAPLGFLRGAIRTVASKSLYRASKLRTRFAQRSK